MRSVKGISLFIYLLFIAGTISGTGISDEMTFFGSENKYLHIDGQEMSGRKNITVYRIRKALEYLTDNGTGIMSFDRERTVSSQPIVSAFLDRYFDGYSVQTGRKYGLDTDFFFSSVGSGSGIFMPLDQIGLYAVNIESGTGNVFMLVNVTDLALLVKRDRVHTLVYSQNRETGKTLSSVPIRLNDLTSDSKRKRRKQTDFKGFLEIDNRDLAGNGLIVGKYSNSLDIVHAEKFYFLTNNAFRPVTMVDKRSYRPGGELVALVMLYEMDIFKDYQAARQGIFDIWFEGHQTPFQVNAVSPATRVVMKVPPGADSGILKLVTSYKGGRWTNDIYVTEEEEKDLSVTIRPEKRAYLRGERIKGRIDARTMGMTRPNQAELSWKYRVIEQATGRMVLEGHDVSSGKRNRAKFRIDTGRFPENDMTVMIEADVVTADGRITRTFEEIPVEQTTERLSLTADKKILQAGEALKLKLMVRNKPNPFETRQFQLVVNLLSEGERTIRSFPVVMKAVSTNITINGLEPGKLSVRVADRNNPALKADTEVWMVPDTGDLHAGGMDEKLMVISDRDGYSFGDIARILLVSGRKGMNALMTFEGDDLYFHQNVYFNNNFVVIDVPVIEPNKPNSVIYVQTMISNNITGAHLNIPVPYANKRIIYSLAPVAQRNDFLRIETDNIWMRGIRTYSMVSIGNRISMLDRNDEDFGNKLYPQKAPGVASYFKVPGEWKANGVKGQRPYKVVWQKGDLLSSADKGRTYFMDDVSSNTVPVTAGGAYGDRNLTFSIRSLTADGKTGLLKRTINIDEPIDVRILLPAHLRAGDHPVMTVNFMDLTGRPQKVRYKADFYNGKVFHYRTNSFLLAGGAGEAVKIELPDSTISDSEIFNVSFEYVTPERSRKMRWAIPVVNTSAGSDEALRISRTYRKLHLAGGKVAALLAGNSFMAEDIILVTLKANGISVLSNTKSILFVDPVPSGFCPVSVPKGRAPDFFSNGEASFILDPGEKSVTIQYYLRARVTGRYVSEPPYIECDGVKTSGRKAAGSAMKRIVF